MTFPVTRLEVLSEEPSAEKALEILLPKIVPGNPCKIRNFRGKQSLLTGLPQLLRACTARLKWEQLKVVVLIDRDNDNCLQLKDRLQRIATEAGLATTEGSTQHVTVLNRIVICELESWFLGDVPALRSVYPRVPASLGEREGFRDPDAISGSAARALDDVLRDHGYRRTGSQKVQT
ncbi:MAG: DUF4276 family protein, partial [Mycobacteriales bacterium]